MNYSKIEQVPLGHVRGAKDLKEDATPSNFFEDLESDLPFTGIAADGSTDNFLDMYNLTPRQRVAYSIKKSLYGAINYFQELALWQRILIGTVGLLGLVGGILVAIFHSAILNYLVDTSNTLRERVSTQFILFLLLFLVGFPPMIGYTLLSTSVGLIYGLSFHGFAILAIGTVLGSVASFSLFKTILHSTAEKLVHKNAKFEAFASILQEDNSYYILALFRLCPFPYSLTNGALAGIYGISIRNFTIATIVTTPKTLLYLFLGSRIKRLGEDTSTNSTLINILSILLTVIVLLGTAWFLYYKTQKRYKELKSRSRGTPGNPATAFEMS